MDLPQVDQWYCLCVTFASALGLFIYFAWLRGIIDKFQPISLGKKSKGLSERLPSFSYPAVVAIYNHHHNSYVRRCIAVGRDLSMWEVARPAPSVCPTGYSSVADISYGRTDAELISQLITCSFQFLDAVCESMARRITLTLKLKATIY